MDVPFDYEKSVPPQIEGPVASSAPEGVEQFSLRGCAAGILVVASCALVGVGAAGLIVEVTEDLDPNTPTERNMSESTTDPSSEEVALTPFEAFQGKETVSQETINLSYNAAVKVLTADISCTGAVINGFLLTAGHCEPGGEGMSITHSRTAAGEDGSIVEHADTWAGYDISDLDLLMAEPDNPDELPGIFFPVIATDNPRPGGRMIASVLPGGAVDPILGSLTYLTELPAITEGPEDQHSGRYWVFAIGPDNSPEAKDKLCDPGASGSAVIDDFGHIAVLTNVIPKDDMSPQEWEAVRRRYEEASGADLSQITTFCLAAPVDRNIYNSLLAAINE